MLHEREHEHVPTLIFYVYINLHAQEHEHKDYSWKNLS